MSAFQLHQLFPTAVATVQLALDPLELAGYLQDLLVLRGAATGNPTDGCAWTGDINGVWQLHRQPGFLDLASLVTAQAWHYLDATGFDRQRIALHLQRCWPVLSECGQVVGRHHHPNAHLSAVLYLTGDGSGTAGDLCLHHPQQLNELVPGLAVGHGGPIDAVHPCNQSQWTITPRAGLLLFFPSRLDHSVLENLDPDVLRVSLSFDFVLTSSALSPPAEYLSPHPQDWQHCSRPMP